MWNKHKYAILSFLLIVGIFLTGVRLPYFAEAAGDVSNKLKNLKTTIIQNGKVVEDNDSIDLNANVTVKVEFDVPVRADQGPEYVEYMDIATIPIGKGLKLSTNIADNQKEAKYTQNGKDIKVGTATFSQVSGSPEKTEMKFVFDGEEEIFRENGKYYEVKAEVSAVFKIDTSNVNTTTSTPTEKITILNKEYTIKPIDDTITIKKSGEVDYKNSNTIKWKVTVTRKRLNTPLPLGGYKFRDNLSKVGAYVNGTFKINESNKTPRYEDSILKYDFTTTDSTSEAEIEFSTRMEENDFLKGKTYKNTARFISPADKEHIAEAEVKWEPKWGSKEKSNVYEAGGERFVDWEIIFNEKSGNSAEPFSLNGVKITDNLPKDRTETKQLEFVSAAREDWDGSKWVSGPAIVNSGTITNTQFNIGNITNKVKLIIKTKVVGVNASIDTSTFSYFWNIAKVTWDSNTEGIKLQTGASTGKAQIVEKHADPYIGTEPVWTVKVKPDNSINNNTFVYDSFIFDTSNIGQLRAGNFTLQKYDDNSVPQFDNEFKKKLIPINYYSQEFISFNNNGHTNLNMVRYKIIDNLNNYVGDVIGVNGFEKNKVTEYKLKSKFTSAEDLMNKTDLSNELRLVQNTQHIDVAWTWKHYNPKHLEKQAFTAGTAKKITDNLNKIESTPTIPHDIGLLNEGIFDNTKKEAEKNSDTAYDIDNKSIMYRISVNAGNMNNIGKYTGPVVVEDKLPDGWKFTEIKGNQKFLIYPGKSFTGVESQDATVEVTAAPVSLPTSNLITTVSAIAPATDQNKVEFAFKNIDKPYVILLKATLIDPNKYFNKKDEVTNTASFTMKKKVESSQKTVVDERIITKESNDSGIKSGKLTWKIEYRPYKFHNINAKVYLEDKLGSGLEIRRLKDSNELVFSGDNYKLEEGTSVNGEFRTLSLDEMKACLSYDKGTRVLKINLPEKKNYYKFSYITDLKNVSSGIQVDNTVKVFEAGNNNTITETPDKYTISSLYAAAQLKEFAEINLIKTDENGGKLKDAVFELKSLSDNTVKEGKTDANGRIEFIRLKPGQYELKEKIAPGGYKLDTNVYTVNIEELVVGFNISVDNKGNNKVSKTDENTITIKNEKTPSTPSNPGGGGGVTPPPTTPETPVTPVVPPKPENPVKPVEPPKPNDPEKPNDPGKPNKPTKPTTPEEPEDPDPEEPDEPEEPDTPDPTPNIPSYPFNNTPDPNDPNSPDEITVIGDDGTPLGRFIKKQKPDGTFEYVDADDGTPLGNIKAHRLPKTGGTGNTWYYAIGAGLILGAGLTFKKRKEEEQED